MRYAMIMAGGAGTRLWPMSRRSRPKQLLPFINGRSLLQIAGERLEGVVSPDRRFICTGESFRELIRESLPEYSDERILGEPVGRDTMNAVGFTAAVLGKDDPEAVFAVLTADHIIEPQEEFSRAMKLGFDLVEDDASRFVTFAITPTHAATGYGYVERGEEVTGFRGCFNAKRFVEKPDLATAEEYVAAGTFGWNSGMFIFSAATFLEAMKRYHPEAYAGLMVIRAGWGTEDQQEVLEEVYPTLPRISVDYGVMEPASGDEQITVCIVPMGVSWLDVGSWPSFGETLTTDGEGNRTNARAMHLDSSDMLVVSDDPGHTIATIGCDDLMVIHTRDATLICPKSEAQRVKEMAESAPPELR